MKGQRVDGEVEEPDGKAQKACPSQVMQENNQLLVQTAVLMLEEGSMPLLERVQEDKRRQKLTILLTEM